MIYVEWSVKDFLKKNPEPCAVKAKTAVYISWTRHLFEKAGDATFVGILVFMGHRLYSLDTRVLF